MSFNSPAGVQDIQNESLAAFGQVNWKIADAVTVTTGVRFTKEDRQTTSSTGIKDNGSAPELNPDVVNNVSLGGFTSNAATGVLGPANSAAQLALADLVALKLLRRRGDRHAGRRVQQSHRAQRAAGGRREGDPPRADRRGVPDDRGEGFEGHPAGLGRQPELEDQRSGVDLRVLAARREGGHLAVRERHLEPGRSREDRGLRDRPQDRAAQRHAGVQHGGVLFGDRGLPAAGAHRR